jgi:hypothetical protein
MKFRRLFPLCEGIFITFLCIIFFGCSDSSSEGIPDQTLFERHFPVEGPRLISGFVEKSGGGFYAVGSSFSDGLLKPFVVSFDQNGDTLWTWKTALDVPFSNQGAAIIETSDGGCMVLLKTSLLTLNSNGSLTNEVSLYAPYQSVIGQIVKAHDSGYLINFVNYATDGPVVRGNSKLLRFDENLELLWSKEYTDKHRDLIKLSGSGYALAPWSDDYSFRLIGNDGLGPTPYIYGDTDQESVIALCQKSDDGFLLAGYFRWSEFSHSYIISTDGQGQVLWEKEYYNGVTDGPLGIIELDNSDIVFIKSGAEQSRDSNTWPGVYKIFSGYKIYLIRTNSNGDIVSEVELKEDNPDSQVVDASLLKTRKGYAILAAINNELVIMEFQD